MISIVIPLFNEEESLGPLYREIHAAVERADLDCEIIFVDDGSRDGSWGVILDLARQDPRVRGIRFRRNFGKAAALSAGFHAVRGSRLITLDADLQDDPKEIPRFLEEMAKGYDVVSGWKRVRHDPWHKVFPSRIFNWLVSRVTGVKLHDHNCGMKSYRAEIFREVRLYGELHRFIPVLAAARGYKVGEIEVHHRARKYGGSKYMGAGRFVKGFLDLMTVKFLTGYGRRPQHLLGSFGMLCFGAGVLGMAWLAVTWIITQYFRPGLFEPLHQRPALIYSLAALLLGAQMMSIGFLAELITAYQSRDEDSYSIAETVRGQESGVRDQESGVRSQESGIGQRPGG
jgi:glycosyltransferase involved in cell wall biosynthesis